MGKWSGSPDDEFWELETEVDRFSSDEPYVVSIFVENSDIDENQAGLACLSSSDARQMSADLLHLANRCDELNEKLDKPSD